MATTIQMFLASTALATNTFLIMLFYFLSNAILGPIQDVVERFVSQYPQTFPIENTTYIIGSIWSILLLFEIVWIIAFVVVIGRRTDVDDYI